MADEWKVLRGDKNGVPEKDHDWSDLGGGKAGDAAQPPVNAPANTVEPEDAARAARYEPEPAATDRYGDSVNTSRPVGELRRRAPEDRHGAGTPAPFAVPGAVLEQERGIPKKHFIVGVVLLLAVFTAWVFRVEVKGLAGWAIASIRGEEVPLSAKAPGLANALRFNKPYTRDEFLAVCEQGDVRAILKVLDSQPELIQT